MATAVSTQMHSRVQEFVGKPRKMFINGKWVEAASGKTFPSYNPATGDVMAQVAEGDREDIESRSEGGAKGVRQRPVAGDERVGARPSHLEARRPDRAAPGGVRADRILDNGKPLAVARVADVPLAVDLFRYMAGWATKIEGNTIPFLADVLSPTRCANRWAWSGRSFRGISRC